MKSPIPLKWFLSLQLGLVAVIPLIAITILVWFLVMPGIHDRTGLRHQAMARSIASQVSAYLKGGERQLTALAEYLRQEHSDSDQAPVHLLDAQCGNGELFEALFIVDDEIRSIQTVGLSRSRRSNRSDYTGLDLSGRGFIGLAKGQQQAVWSRTFSPSDSFEIKGEQMLGALVAMDGLGWKVLVAQPARNALRPIRRTFPSSSVRGIPPASPKQRPNPWGCGNSSPNPSSWKS